MQPSTVKVLASVFWDAQGILFIDYLDKERTINSKYYIALLVHLNEEIAKKQPHMKKKCSFTKCHKSIAMMANLHELHFELLPHPLFSRSKPDRLMAVCRPQKNAPGKDMAPLKK